MIDFIVCCCCLLFVFLLLLLQGSMFSLSDPSQIHCELNVPSQLTTPTNNCNGETSDEVIIIIIS